MNIVNRWLVVAGLLFVMVATGAAQRRGGQAPPLAPNVTGNWTGTWLAYDPSKPDNKPEEQCKSLNAKITQEAGAWHAVFEGDCGQPYKYTITMDGRQVGGAILFKGTTDIGQGAIYDWIGYATDAEFVGFYTSGRGTGLFTMTRAK